MAASSVQLAEHGGERHGVDRVAMRVGDAKLPAAPVFAVRRHDQRADETFGAGADFGEIVDGGTAVVDAPAEAGGPLRFSFEPLS